MSIRNAVPDRSVALIESIVLGIRDDLSTSDRDAFRDTGTIHLLAISGLHLQAVAMFVLLLSRRTGIRPEVASIGVVAFTCFYALIVTGGASVLRATVMALAMASSTIRQRPGDFRHRFVLAARDRARRQPRRSLRSRSTALLPWDTRPGRGIQSRRPF